MFSRNESKATTITYELKQREKCCVCGDIQILINYMGFEICPFCASGEKKEDKEESMELI